jgi:hypothetical protein
MTEDDQTPASIRWIPGPSFGIAWEPDGIRRWDNGVESFTPYPPPTETEIAQYELIRQHGHCRVFWGSHDCHLERGHQGPHRCDDDCPPAGYGKWWRVFGEDIWWPLRAWEWIARYPGGHRRLWWLIRHRKPWPQMTVQGRNVP